jgi:hypothetical protein
VVIVFACQLPNVQRQASIHGKRLPELANALGSQLTDLFPLKLNVGVKATPSADIHNGLNQGFIHRDYRNAVPLNARIRLQRLANCLTQNDSNVFDRVVIIDEKITLRLDPNIELTVKRKLLKHVIEESDPSCDVLLRTAVQV